MTIPYSDPDMGAAETHGSNNSSDQLRVPVPPFEIVKLFVSSDGVKTRVSGSTTRTASDTIISTSTVALPPFEFTNKCPLYVPGESPTRSTYTATWSSLNPDGGLADNQGWSDVMFH